MPYNNVSAHCTSEIMKFTVTFMDQDGNVAEVVEGVPYGTEINTILPVAPEGYSYEFDEVIEGQVKSEMTISLFKVVNKYDVTINGEIVSLAYGTDIIAYVNDNYKAEEGYHIVITASHDTVPANNTATVEYVFEANVWMLTYSTEGADENISGSKEVAFGTNILSVLPLTEKEGYNFNGWFDGEKQLSSDDTMPNNDININGTYSIKKFNVTIIDGETTILNKSYDYKTKLENVLNEQKVVSYIDSQSANGYTVSFDVNVNEELTKDIEINVVKSPNTYILTFMNGGELISETSVKFGEVINYPSMENKTENGVEYIFVWEDETYNGKSMPNMNLVIKGNYQEKADAPIYYGTFVTSAEEINSDIFDINNLKDFQNVSLAECVDGKDITITVPADKYLVENQDDITEEELEEYMSTHFYPHCFLIPSEILKTYQLKLMQGGISEVTSSFTTDGKEININGTQYFLYGFLNKDAFTPDTEDYPYPYKIQLIK